MPAAIGLALFTLGAPLAVVNFVTVGFGATLVSLGIGTGLSLAAASLFSPNQTSPVLKPSAAQQTIRQAVPPRWRHYGRVRVAGPQFWFDTEQAQGELFFGLCINEGLIDEFEQFHIDDNTVELDGSFDVTTPPYDLVTTKILSRQGLTTETEYTEIDTDFGYFNVRGDGVATVLGIFDNFATAELQREHFPNGLPKLRVTIRASVVWDGRDAAQIRTDATTWQWSENPVICLLDYFLSTDGFGLSYDRFVNSIQDWFDAADICEEQVWSPQDSQFEDRYRIAATYLFTDDPANIVRRFEQTFGGRTWQQRDGSIGIITGKFKVPSVTLGDDAILRFNLERGEDRLTAVAGVRAQYMSPAHDFREQDAIAWPDGATVFALTDKRVVNLPLNWTPSHGQARRLMEAVYERAQAKWSGQIVTNLSGLRAFDERYIRVQIAELGIDDDFEVDHYTLDLSRLEVTLDLTSAKDITDPARPLQPTSGLFYRGSGHIGSNDADPEMVYTGLDDGDPPEVGDLVIWFMTGISTPGWVTPAGWTVIQNTAGAARQVQIFRIITQADIDTPPSPFSSSGNNTWTWVAFNPAEAGAPTADLVDFVNLRSDPAPVSADASGIAVQFVLCSAHSASRNPASPLTSPKWINEIPQLVQSESFPDTSGLGTASSFLHRVYRDGDGKNVTADMNDEGSDNYSCIFVIKFV